MVETDGQDLRDRMAGTPTTKGDRLAEILDSNQGGDAKKLRDRLGKLWEAAETPKNDSVEWMRARNAAIRLAKGAKPRRPDSPGLTSRKGKAKRQRVKAVPTYRIRGAGLDMQLSLCERHRAKLKAERPELKATVMAKRGKRCEACEYRQSGNGANGTLD